jgi:hypothetical protein
MMFRPLKALFRVRASARFLENMTTGRGPATRQYGGFFSGIKLLVDIRQICPLR